MSTAKKILGKAKNIEKLIASPSGRAQYANKLAGIYLVFVASCVTLLVTSILTIFDWGFSSEANRLCVVSFFSAFFLLLFSNAMGLNVFWSWVCFERGKCAESRAIGGQIPSKSSKKPGRKLRVEPRISHYQVLQKGNTKKLNKV